MAVSPANVVPVVISSFVAWRVYRRIRRDIGRQLFQPRRMIARIVIFSVLSVVLAIFSLANPRVLLGEGGGLLLGALVALVGLRLTRCELTAEGRFYTPNTYIGIALSMLLVGRLIYRGIVLYDTSVSIHQPPPAVMQSPLTFFVFGLVAGYYIVYYLGVLSRCRALKQSEA